MKNKVLFSVSSILLLGLTTTAVATGVSDNRPQRPRTQQEMAKIRAERNASRDARKKVAKPVSMPEVKVYGGKNNDKPLYGSFVSTYDGIYQNWSGPVQVSASGNHKQLGGVTFEERAFAGCYYDGKYLSLQHDPTRPKQVRYQVYDAETWTLQNNVNYTVNSSHVLGSGLTYVPTTKTIYGMFFESTPSYIGSSDAQLGYINPDNVFDPVTIIGEMGVRMRAMAATADGTLYGISYVGDIYTINTQTAALTQVSTIKWPDFGWEAGDPATPFSFYGNDAAVIDYETGMMYLSYSDGNDDTFILKVDPKTGDTQVLANYGYYSAGGRMTCDVITGIYFKQQAATAEDAPLCPTDVSVSPVGTEQKASVSFIMPTKDINGQPLPQTSGWAVGNGTDIFATGEALPGTEVVAQVPVAQLGANTLFVYAVNGTSKSNPVRVEVFIGPDTPVITKKPMVVVNGQMAIVRWETPQGANGGNLASPQNYKIVRMPDNYVVNDAATGNSCVDNITSEIKTEYYYNITPRAGEMIGETATSRSAYVGSYFGMPHYNVFDNAGLFNEYPVIDANQDGNIWWIDVKQGAAIYSSNERNADDYLLVGPFKLQANNLYNFAMTAGGHSIAETVAAYVGTDPENVASFNTEIIPETVVDPTSTGDLRLTGAYTAQADGLYYFAIKACSRSGSQNLYVYNVEVTGVSAKSPAAPVITTVTPKLHSAVLDFTVPSRTLDNTAAAGATSVRIYRDNKLVTTITDRVADGAQLSWEDTDAVSTGLHTYKVVAVNEVGEGQAATVEVYRGLDIPGTPTRLRVYEDLHTPGLMHVSWDAPTRGYHGGYINPDELSYIVDYMSTGEGAGILENVAGTSCEIQLNSVNKQNVISASVYGVNAAGSERMSWATGSGYYGAALPLPLHESWVEMSQRSGLWVGESLVDKQELFESMWDICNGELTSIVPQDEDGGYMGCTTQSANSGYRIRSPRVDVSKVQNPMLTFYYRYTDKVKEYRVEILVDDQPIRTLKTLNTAATKVGSWIREQISLAEFKNSKYIQLSFTAIANEPAEEFACLDNVSISDFVENDLGVIDFTAPVKSNVNEDIIFILKVRNHGSNLVTENDYSIKLYKNNQMIAEAPGVEIAADAFAEIPLYDLPVVTDPVSTEYYAELVYADDKRAENNRSATKLVRIVPPVYPGVTDLQGQINQGVELTWSDPSAADMPSSPVTESFENYQKFAISNLGSWGLHDGDGAPTVILGDPVMGLLNYQHIGEKMAWQVIDPVAANITSTAWTPRTGENMLVSFQACKDGKRDVASDDWLISPELYGKAQTISFYAKVGLKTYSPEIIDVMYSTTGNAVTDFKPLKSDVEILYAKDWTEYLFELPEGARYFAIVHKSYDRLALLLDDITYIPSGSTAEKVELLGYNVYRNGEKLNSELIGDTQYIDNTTQNGNEYTYYVTAVWDKGESGLSNAVVINVISGIDNATSQTIRIYPSNRTLCMDGADGLQVAVYNAAGACVANTVARGHTVIPVSAPGVYLVKVGHKVAKVAVK